MGNPSVQRARQLFAAGQPGPALAAARRAAAQGDAESLRTLADMLAATGSAEQAAHYYERALRVAPSDAVIRSNFAHTLMQLRRHDAAVAQLEEAVRLAPGYAGAWSNLIRVLTESGRIEDAVRAGRDAAAKFPHDSLIARNLTVPLVKAGLASEAESVLRAALAGGPPSVELLSPLACIVGYSDKASPSRMFEDQVALGRAVTAGISPGVAAHTNTPDPDRPLRIGYLTPAFVNHSAGHFIEPILAHHDRAMYPAHCYSGAVTPDELTARVRAASSGWAEAAGLSHRALADRIRSDGIDIAVDLAGHTLTSMLGALCFRPAPVQVTYLGYPHSTGLAAIDYRLVDARTDPPGAEALATEALIRLDPCFLCYAPPPHAPEVEPRPEGPITFGSFNTNAKLSDATLDAWSRILRENPGSRLVLKNLDLGDPGIARMRRPELAAKGIEHVELLGQTASEADHLRAYSRIDIALDPFPYNGTTTTVEALWMGVPVVALAGQAHVSRVGVSLLSTVGLTDLIAPTAEGYIRIATDLAHDAPRRRQLRGTLRAQVRNSPLCDGPGFTRRLEEQYRRMWRAWCAAARA